MLSGETLGAYCLSEPAAGSDVAAMTTRAEADGAVTEAGEPAAYRISGTKSWISHAGHADYYTTFARTSPEGSRGISCFVVPADAERSRLRRPREEDGPALRHRP